jgi:hypothetical protein
MTNVPIGEISRIFFGTGVRNFSQLIIMTYVNLPDPIKPLIPALCEILPQVGTIKSGIFAHCGLYRPIC